MSDDALRAAEQLINDVWGGAIGVDDPEIEIIARHLAAYAEARVKQEMTVPTLKHVCRIAVETGDRAKAIEDAARAVVEECCLEVFEDDEFVSIQAEKLRALAAALGEEAEDAE